MALIIGSLTKGISSPISRGFEGRATHLIGEGEPPPPHYLDALFLFLLFFAVPPLEPSLQSLFLALLLFFCLVTAPLSSPPSGGVVLLLVLMRDSGRGEGSEKYASVLTHNMSVMAEAEFL